MSKSQDFTVTIRSDHTVSPVEVLAGLQMWSEGEWDVDRVVNVATGDTAETTDAGGVTTHRSF